MAINPNTVESVLEALRIFHAEFSDTFNFRERQELVNEVAKLKAENEMLRKAWAYGPNGLSKENSDDS